MNRISLLLIVVGVSLGIMACQPSSTQEKGSTPPVNSSTPKASVPPLPSLPEIAPEQIITGRWRVIDMQDGGMIEKVSAQLPPNQAQIFRARMTEMVNGVKKGGYRLFLPEGRYLNLVNQDTVMEGVWMVINQGKALLTKPLNSNELPNQFKLRSLSHDALIIEEPLNFPGPDSVQTYITTFILQKEKIEFPLTQLDGQGMAGPTDGKRSLAYEFCIPADSAFVNHLHSIAPRIQVIKESAGRIGCGEDWCLCIGETDAEFRPTLERISSLPYVHRIIETVFE